MVVFVFCLACSVFMTPMHHIVVFDLQLSFMYLINALEGCVVLVILSSCSKAQLSGSLLTLHPLPYMISLTF